MALWVPPKVAEELVDRRKDYTRRVLGLMHLEGGILNRWNAELRKIDPHLRLGQAFESVPEGYPLVPGYYHLVRLNPDAPPTTEPIMGPNGEFVEPSGQMLERLRASDLQNPAVMRDRQKREQLAEELKERATARLREERRDELFGRLAAATETRVSMVPGWSQNAAGKRGRK